MITFEKDGLIKSDEAIKNLAENPSQVVDFPLPVAVKPYRVLTTGYFRQIPYTGSNGNPYSITLALCYLESQLLEIPCNGEQQIRICENEDTVVFIRVSAGATRKRVSITGLEKKAKPSEPQSEPTQTSTETVSETALNPNASEIAKLLEERANFKANTAKTKKDANTARLAELGYKEPELV